MPGKGPQPTALALDAPNPLPRLRSSSTSSSPLEWIPVVSLEVQCSVEHFQDGLVDLVLQPEHSSSTILRADVLADDELDSPSGSGSEELAPFLEGYRCVRRLRRRILPNRPQFDWAMEQECLFYQRRVDPEDGADDSNETPEREGLVVLLPDFEQLRQEDPQGRLPYYHPQVHALAFRYLPSSSRSSPASLRIDLVPLPSQPAVVAPLAQSDRLFRTALVLVKFTAKLCTGHADGWQKRVHHDLLVGKEEVQDLYQKLKDKYKWMLASWRESTDATKHVFEDVAIAAWLMVLWREMYAKSDGRPPGGFVDVGCGNGLLVFILNAEGYNGYGFDLRARKSWSAYSPAPDLRVSSIHPPSLVASCHSDPSTSAYPPGSFLIGNHADELTPWLPLLAACTPRSAFLNIPCCLHELHGRFDRQAYTVSESFLSALPAPPPASSPSPATDLPTHPLLHPFYAPTPLALSSTASGPSVTGGRYAAYQLYLAHLTLRCGFVPEREALRIPSTKNFGMVGRRRLYEGMGEKGEERVWEELESVLREVERRGEWRARKPEGKAGDKDH